MRISGRRCPPGFEDTNVLRFAVSAKGLCLFLEGTLHAILPILHHTEVLRVQY